MISLSTHTLDATTGAHAAGVNVRLFTLIEDKIIELWSRQTDDGGRLLVQFELDLKYKNCDLQLSFYINNYFSQNSGCKHYWYNSCNADNSVWFLN